jgi:MFS family permease
VSDARADTLAPAAWSELLSGGRRLYSVMILLGVGIHALQNLVMAIIMPTVVADLGGADYYTWPSMLYTVGAIIGSASLGPLWRTFGQRKGYAISAFCFFCGTVSCALAPDMAVLNAARAVQGFSGGLITGGGMALISALFTPAQRKRLLAAHQGIWMIAQLSGPIVGGAFAEIGWWRGSFWVTAPIMLGFAVLCLAKLPEGREEAAKAESAFPIQRLGILTTGVFAVALAGPIGDAVTRPALIAVAALLVWLTFHLDGRSTNKLYPSGALSLRWPVGLAMWILFAASMLQTSVTLFLPLLLQVVLGVKPLFVSVISIVISCGWTIATFLVSGWNDWRERAALRAGPLFVIAGVAGLAATTLAPHLGLLAVFAFIQGFGLGMQNPLLVSLAMANARKGEERITSSAIPSIRSMGTAFGAAFAGLLSTTSGLGDATEPAAVAHAITMVYGFNILPLTLAAILMFRLTRR